MLVHKLTIYASDKQEISILCICITREELPESARGVKEAERRAGKRFAKRTGIMEYDPISL